MQKILKTEDGRPKTEVEGRKAKGEVLHLSVAIKSFRDLEIYQESMRLALEVEKLVRKYPKHEQYLLVDQLRRASRAVPALIAEAWSKRKTLKAFQKTLRDAIGECNEMVAHIEMADHFGYITKKGYAKELIERYDNSAGKISSFKDNWQNF